MSDYIAERIHPASPQRRQLARQEGRVAKSHDLVVAAVLLGGTLVLMALGGKVVMFFADYAQQQFGGESWLSMDADTAVDRWRATMWDLARVVLPVLGLLALLAIAANFVQFGFLFAPKKLAFDTSRVSPLKGLQRMFSAASLIRLAFSITKIAAVASVGVWSLWGQRERLLDIGAMDGKGIAGTLAEIGLWTCAKMGVMLLVLGLADYGYQRWRHERDLRMTTDELREEMRRRQASPSTATRRKELQRQLIVDRVQSIAPLADRP